MDKEKETARRDEYYGRLEKCLRKNFTGMGKRLLCQFRFEKTQPATLSAEHLQSYMQRLHHYDQDQKAKESQETPACHHENSLQPNT